MLRTFPPDPLNLTEGVAALNYSGAFPATRLRVLDESLPLSVELVAMSSFFPEASGKMNATANPGNLVSANCLEAELCLCLINLTELVVITDEYIVLLLVPDLV